MDMQKGTVTIDGTVYQLRYDYEALCAFGDEVGATLENLQEMLGTLKLGQMHLLLWAGMLAAGSTLSPAEVKQLLKGRPDSAWTIGDAQGVLAQSMKLFTAAMAPVEAEGEDGPQAKTTARQEKTAPPVDGTAS
jgi:hypothetical protein